MEKAKVYFTDFRAKLGEGLPTKLKRLIKTAGIAAWYMAKYELGYFELTLWRLLNYTLIAVAEIAILYLLLRHRGFQRQMERMCRK